MEVGSSCGPSRAPGPVVQVSFPAVQTSVLDSLNRQREQGQLCDLSIHVQDHVFKAHRCVLAASSPYFHDQVLLKNMSTVSIPAVMDPLAFESVLSCAYTGQLRMLRDDIVNYLTVGSVLQMWHIVDKCTELLKEGRATGTSGGTGGGTGGGGVPNEDAVRNERASANPGCSSSNGNGGAASEGRGEGAGSEQGTSGSSETQRTNQPTHPSLSESQSPSSTNYFSPRDGSGFGGNAAATSASGDGAGSSHTSSYCTPSGGEEAFLIEEEEEEEEEEEIMYHQRKRARVGGSARRKKTSSLSEQEVGVSDSFGVSSYQDGEEQKRPAYSQPSIMPRKQWVVVKTERAEEDDDLIVVSGEEAGDDEDEDEEREAELSRERNSFNISNVRSLSAELGHRSENDMESHADYCSTPEDYLKFEGSLMEQTLAQQLHESTAQSSNRAVSALLGQVQSAATARALFPLDMQGNQILLYSQATGLSMDSAAAPMGLAGGMIPGTGFKGPGLEHGAAHLSLQGGLDGADGGGAGNNASGKVFMCHCGKTFTHKSMRDRHINMHLDLRPFHCPVCSKKFKMKHHLTEHMKTHTGLKPYDCHGCGKKFMWRDSFMRHRAHCERRGGEGGGEGGGEAGETRRHGEDAGEMMSSPHLVMSETGHGGGRAQHGGGNGGVANGNLSDNNVALLGPASQSHSQGSGLFAGLAMGRSLCEEDACEVNQSSVA
ncbi:zinc finger and BTB domain-containing protein 22-like [Eucyclogobius newberryi]|uniref:zinc finger and BTB domain-containing protein 22-like n=1 Tax=Eucyclogobius newberryi TaxID=166745 RepID=UPI003B5C4FC7